MYETRLLGVTITSDCEWNRHVSEIVKIANRKLWFIRRLKVLGASVDTLVDTYKLFVRQGLELAVPLWAPALSEGNSYLIERVQSKVSKVIIGPGPHSQDYKQRISTLSLSTLSQRRSRLTTKFALKMANDEKYDYLFPRRQNNITRHSKPFIEPQYTTKRFQCSSIPSFIRIANQEANKRT